ncbi:MAG TPA: hypothetical protein VGK96_28590 [Candidatus Sulfotelmatobacter sp.]|jgi:hypothetical protein
MIRRPIVHRRNRRKLQNGIGPAGVQATLTAHSVAANVVTATLSTTVQLQGIPRSWTVQGVAPTAAVQTSATTINLTYAAAVTTNTFAGVANDPNVTTPSGGFVQGFSVTL